MRFLALFILVSLAEMAAFIWVGSQIGFGWALGIAVATAIIGGYLVKREGLSTLGRIKTKMNAGQVPGRELSDGAAILVSALLGIAFYQVVAAVERRYVRWRPAP